MARRKLTSLEIMPIQSTGSTPQAPAIPQQPGTIATTNNINHVLKEDMVATLLEAWEKGGRKKFLQQCKERFDQDAIKLVKEIYLPLMPKEATTVTKSERAVIRIDLNPQLTQQPITIDAMTEHATEASE